MTTIGLCMIVKNEASVIERCLRSVRPLVDYAVIEDTGSTDDTQRVISNYLAEEGLPGEIFEEPWQDFAWNRSLALERLRQQPAIDYALIMDADDVVVLAEDFDPQRLRSSLNQDIYHVQLHRGTARYWRPQVVSNRKHFRYRGVLHEFIEGPPEGSTTGTLRDFHVICGVEGHRSQNPHKYKEDAALLERILETEKEPFLIARYTFYMAQSLRDAGEQTKALDTYLRRAELGFWIEEVFISLYNVAGLRERLGYPDTEVIGSYLAAHEVCPHRAEALHGAMRFCRIKNKFQQGYEIGTRAITLSEPSGLFVEPWVYRYGLWDEFSILAYWTDHFAESAEAADRALACPELPEGERERVRSNARLAHEKCAPILRQISPPIATLGLGCATVVAIAPEGYVHAAALAEVAETVLHGLRRLGYDATLTSDLAAAKGRTVLVGAHLLAGHAVVPGDAIIYNSEHVESAWIRGADHVNYRRLLREHEVWDYSPNNAALLATFLGKRVRHVSLGYVAELTRIAPASEQDIDVLFYGSLNDRRRAVLDQLRQSGLAVKWAFDVYGEQRDALIARSKVVLSMHYYLPGAFEIVRVSYAMANRKVVIAEVNPGEDVDADLLPGIVAVPYERLAEACRLWVEDDDGRRELEDTAFRTFSARDMASILRQHLATTGESMEQPLVSHRDLMSTAVSLGNTEASPFWSIADHAGLDYVWLLTQIHRQLNPKSYLEIGTRTGDTLALADCPSIAVDPHFQINRDIIGSKQLCCLFQMKSDDFFLNHDPHVIIGKPIDLAFIDGLHMFEFALRDFINIEKYVKNNSIVVLDDCIPTDAYIARRTFESQIFLDASRHPNWWAGDVWKVVLILKQYRPDLKICAFNAPETGIVAVTNLDPRSDILRKSYFDIVKEYRSLTLHAYGVDKYLYNLDILDTSIMTDFASVAGLFWL
jgi:glycosyltransferase involved in cell wall biosynthesis